MGPGAKGHLPVVCSQESYLLPLCLSVLICTQASQSFRRHPSLLGLKHKLTTEAECGHRDSAGWGDGHCRWHLPTGTAVVPGQHCPCCHTTWLLRFTGEEIEIPCYSIQMWGKGSNCAWAACGHFFFALTSPLIPFSLNQLPEPSPALFYAPLCHLPASSNQPASLSFLLF